MFVIVLRALNLFQSYLHSLVEVGNETVDKMETILNNIPLPQIIINKCRLFWGAVDEAIILLSVHIYKLA